MVCANIHSSIEVYRRMPKPSTPSPGLLGSLPATGRVPTLEGLPARVKPPLQFFSFWGAIALPFVHVPLLAQGLDDPALLVTFLSLLALNVVALYLGHGYNRS